MESINSIFFWSAIILCSITIFRMCLSKKVISISPKEQIISENVYTFIFAAITFTAVFIRFYQFGVIPGGFNQDGAMAAVDAKALADYGTDRYGMRFPVHLTAWGYGQMSSLLSYLMVPFIKLFGLTPVAARLPQLIISLIGLGCLYMFIHDVFGKNAALIVYFFAAINPWHILQSRWALDCNLYPHFFIMGIFLLNRALGSSRRLLYLCTSMISFGLCMYCYGISIYTMPVFLVITCIYLLATHKIAFKEASLAFVIYLLVAWPFITVMAINYFKWDTIQTPIFTLPYFPDSVRSNDILFFSENFGKQLANNVRSLLNVTILQKKDLPWNDIEHFGTMYLFSIPFAVLGLFGLFRDCIKKAGTVFILFFLLTGIWSGLVTSNVNINRLNIIYYPILMLAGLGIYEIMRWFPLPHIEFGVIAAYIVAFGFFIQTYFTDYAVYINYFFFKDYASAVSALKDTDVQKYYITSNCTYQNSSLVSEILTLFWHEVDAEYFQGRSTPTGSLPYNEKYNFQFICNLEIDPAEDAAYVIADYEAIYFDTILFNLEKHGCYYLVTPKK